MSGVTDADQLMPLDEVAYYQDPAGFFARLRGLMLAGFYSLPEGIADIGYIGNEPHLGAYPGPTPEAMAHLNAALTKLGLKPFSSG